MHKTIYDIAKIAGVSPSTVSRVINNNYPVKKETRELVEKAIEKEGYRPNLIAKGLITKNTLNLGVVVPGITNLFFPSIVEEINNNLASEGFTISLFTTSGDFTEERKVIDNITSRRMDGIFIIDPSKENLENGYLAEISARVPTLVVNGMTDIADINFISYNEETGTKEALDYLHRLGHRAILFIRGDSSISYDLREKVYKRHTRDNKLDYCNVISVGQGNTASVIEETEKVIRRWTRNGPDATAIFACNDLMAMGALNGLIKEGLKVPDDISIIGFDNTILSTISNPNLTTVDIDVKFIGKKASEMMLFMVRNKEIKVDRIIMDTSVKYRESCKERIK